MARWRERAAALLPELWRDESVREQGGDLQNAAAVAFYEHLFDAWDVHGDVVRWLDARAVQECWPLWEARLDPDKLAVLRSQL